MQVQHYLHHHSYSHAYTKKNFPKIIITRSKLVTIVAIQDLANALTHSPEGRTVHGHT